MKWRSLGLSAILLGSLLMREALAWLAREGSASLQLQHAASPPDAESHFAAGKLFPLACADIIDVELIPGVSDHLARELLASHAAIAAKAAYLPRNEALQLVRGVGPALGATLSGYLSLEDRCRRP